MVLLDALLFCKCFSFKVEKKALDFIGTIPLYGLEMFFNRSFLLVASDCVGGNDVYWLKVSSEENIF